MADASENPLEILSTLARQPATSYHEARVAGRILAQLEAAGIKHRTDSYGNILAHLNQDVDARTIALIAHMDHPGFELVQSEGRGAVARMLGRVSDVVYDQRIPLRVITTGNETHAWTAGRVPEVPGGVRLELEHEVALPAFAVFDLPDFEADGELVRMRAADDLAGCAAILAVLDRLNHEQLPVRVIGIFTRAEEEGLIGARLLATDHMLEPKAIVISVESSRILPGVDHGKGPIIRTGDAATTFSAEAEGFLLAARAILQSRRPPIPVQRQLMSGGTCEASAFVLQGYSSTGIAFPLGHYHNGLGEDRIQAEFIHVSDFLGGIELLLETVRAAARGELPPAYARLRTRPEAEAKRLEQTRSA